MKRFLKKSICFVAASAMIFGMVACGDKSSDNGDANTGSEEKGNVNLSYVEWDTEIASTNVVKTVLEDMGYTVEITPLDNAIMWSSVATGESDGMVAAWLPGTHKDQYEQYKDEVEDLGANLTGAKIGLVVPAYMTANSIEDLTTEAENEITGIEAGAGVVGAAEKAVAEYPNLEGWEVVTSSSGAMVAALSQKISENEDIIVTGWSPHWMFATYDLKYLDDPKGVFGGAEEIRTIVRKGLKEDKPEVYNVLDKFHWDIEDMEATMLEISEGKTPEEAARAWVDANPDKVKEWIE